MMNLFSPAKINLYLAVTGRRDDGYHSLVSLVAPLEFGDELQIVECREGGDLLRCDRAEIPTGPENLILQAASLFRRATGIGRFYEFHLCKRIPVGGGFGGGSSNAVCALRGLNRICGEPLGFEELFRLAAELGSDCPLFLFDGPVIIRGRGEKVEPMPLVGKGLTARKVHLFTPGFFSSTASLFGQLARTGAYTSPDDAENGVREVVDVLSSDGILREATNDLGRLLAEKYLVFGALFAECRKEGLREFGVTGSGSGAFLLSRNGAERAKIRKIADRFLGEDGFLIETEFRLDNPLSF